MFFSSLALSLVYKSDTHTLPCYVRMGSEDTGTAAVGQTGQCAGGLVSAAAGRGAAAQGQPSALTPLWTGARGTSRPRDTLKFPFVCSVPSVGLFFGERACMLFCYGANQNPAAGSPTEPAAGSTRRRSPALPHEPAAGGPRGAGRAVFPLAIRGRYRPADREGRRGTVRRATAASGGSRLREGAAGSSFRWAGRHLRAGGRTFSRRPDGGPPASGREGPTALHASLRRSGRRLSASSPRRYLPSLLLPPSCIWMGACARGRPPRLPPWAR